MNWRVVFGGLFLAVVAFFLIINALNTHPFGRFTDADGNIIVDTSMDDHIIDNTQTETGADNSVTAVVFDYRGFDTLGEATVLFTAVAGVIVLFRRLKK
jgi:multisubunit Na+/H+ antiporter MnhB subunit